MGTLHIVATPIGNLEDITLRALCVLGEVDVIYCEDTRVTKKLLDKYEISTPLKRLDANVEREKAKEVVNALAEGKSVAYTTDAGTPAISDPGYRLVATVRQAGAEQGLALRRSEATPVSCKTLRGATGKGKALRSVEIVSVPGPSAITAALSISGVPADKFLFLGFLPHKKGRQTLLKRIADTKETVVLYESPHRILKLLGELDEHLAPAKEQARQITVVREATKMHEDVQVGTARGIAEYLENANQARGEFVVIISPK